MNIGLIKEIDRQIMVALGMLVVGHADEAKRQLTTIHVGLSIVIDAIESVDNAMEIDEVLDNMTKQATEACKNGGAP